MTINGQTLDSANVETGTIAPTPVAGDELTTFSVPATSVMLVVYR